MTKADLTWQPTNDPNTNAYHTRYILSGTPESGSRGAVDDLGEFGRLILDIPGVVQVHVQAYVLLVTKAPLFDWDEVDSEVTKILVLFAASQKQLDGVDLARKNEPESGVAKRRAPSPRAIREGRATD
jgi:hypothetical protein